MLISLKYIQLLSIACYQCQPNNFTRTLVPSKLICWLIMSLLQWHDCNSKHIIRQNTHWQEDSLQRNVSNRCSAHQSISIWLFELVSRDEAVTCAPASPANGLMSCIIHAAYCQLYVKVHIRFICWSGPVSFQFSLLSFWLMFCYLNKMSVNNAFLVTVVQCFHVLSASLCKQSKPL